MSSKDVWIFLFMLGVLLFNWPLLHIAGGVLPQYLFEAWSAYILVIWLFGRRGAGSGGGE